MPKRIQPVIALAIVPILFLTLFFFYPLANILRISLTGEVGVQDGGVLALLQRPFVWRILWFTTWQSPPPC